MPTYATSASITASRGRVWSVLSDVAAWPEWLPTVTKVEPLDGNSLRVGARFVLRQPKLLPATWTVSALEHPVRFVWVAGLPGLRMVGEHTITEDTPSSSHVELRFTFAGLLGGIIGRHFRAITQTYIEQEAASLKRKVEASH
jgi:ribosome-associated toxin RatA of RatAB toxin-antitoxin module